VICKCADDFEAQSLAAELDRGRHVEHRKQRSYAANVNRHLIPQLFPNASREISANSPEYDVWWPKRIALSI
jgi:hypothetical protein